MKILHSISSIDPSNGGTSEAVRSVIPELEKLGVQNEVVCLDDHGSDFIGKDSFKIHALGASKGPWAYNKALLHWLLQKMPDYDVVIVPSLKDEEEIKQRFPKGYKAVTPYLRLTPQPERG